MGILVLAVVAVTVVVVISKNKNPNNKTKRSTQSIKIKKPAKKPTKKLPNAVGKIYTTTDGFFTNRSDIKKTRIVAVVEKRKDDGAIGVVKIYKKKGKEAKQKEGKRYIPDLTLSPSKHKALTEDSIVGRNVIFGVKEHDIYTALYPRAFLKTKDKLTASEIKTVQMEVHNDTPEHRQSYEVKKQKWENHFKK